MVPAQHDASSELDGPAVAGPEAAEPEAAGPGGAGPGGARVAGDGRRSLAHPVGLLAAAALAVGLASALHQDSRLAVLGVALAQGVLILSWVFGTGLPGRAGAIVLGAAAAAASDAVVSQWPKGELGTLVAVVGLAVAAMFAHQLLRRRARVRVVESLSGNAVLLVATVALATLLQLRHQPHGSAMAAAVVLCAGAALVAGHLVDWIWAPLRFDPSVRRGLLAVIASIAAGAAVVVMRLHPATGFPGNRPLLLGAAIAAVTALFAVGADFIEVAPLPSGVLTRWLRRLSGTLLCLALMSPIAYLLCLSLRR